MINLKLPSKIALTLPLVVGTAESRYPSMTCQEKSWQEDLRALQRLAAMLGQVQDVPSIIRQTQDTLQVLMGARQILWLVADEPGETLGPVVQQPEDDNADPLVTTLDLPLAGLHLSLSAFPPDWREGILAGQPCISHDAAELVRHIIGSAAANAVQQAGWVRSAIGLPLCSSGSLWGMIIAVTDHPTIREEDLSLGIVAAGLLGLRLESLAAVQARRQAEELVYCHKEHATNLEEAYAKLEKTDKEKDEFIQDVSHKLRTPLTILYGYVQLLVEGNMGALTEAQRDCMDTVMRRTQQLIGLVDSIVALATVHPKA